MPSLVPVERTIGKNGKQVCGAKLQKRDGYCQSPVVMSNGRCRLHGGRVAVGVASGLFKTGRYSMYLPTNLLPDYERMLADPDLLTLRHEIALVDALIMAAIRKLDTGESGEAWNVLREAFADVQVASQRSDMARLLTGFDRMRQVIEDGVMESAARQELLDLIERRRKLIETEQKMLVNLGLMLSVNEVMTFISVVWNIIERHVQDKTTRSLLGAEIRRLLVERAGQPAGPAGTDGRFTVDVS